MLGFWIIAAGTAVITIAILGRALLSGSGTGGPASTDAYDVQVYRDQLSELDRDVARGVIGEAEAERARVETSRRLLEADRRAQAATGPASAPRGLTWAALAISAGIIGAGGLGLYSVAGAPGTTDLPLATRIEVAEAARAERPGQDALEAGLPDWPGPPPEAPADYVDMVDKLRAALDDRPDDLEGQELLTQHEGALGNYVAAHRAMARVIELKGDAVVAADHATHAELMVLAARGQVSPEAEAAVRRALEIDPRNGIALYYLGLMYGQNDRPDLGFPIWRDLLERSGPHDPWSGPIRGQIGQLAAMAGVEYTPPVQTTTAPAIGGPSAADMEAAANMTDAERGEMIQGMVTGLMDRLATEGGTAEEWAQLIGALAVLGQTDAARGIWGEAQSVFAEIPQALELIDNTARSAGLEDPVGFSPSTTAPATPPATAAEAHGADAVTALMAQLAAEGGTPAEWARLIGALAAQGDSERARVIWGEARSAFATQPAAVDMIDAAATEAGLSDPIGFDGTAESPAAPALPGPDADDIAAAAELSDEDRAAMIDGMVTRLSDELATNGGPPEKWVMLLRSLGQLGEMDRARAVWGEAQKYFEGDEASLAAVRTAAEALGVTE